MVNEILNFLAEIKSQGQCFFIEAEAQPRIMMNFINSYNSRTHQSAIDFCSEGIICLQNNSNKWGIELRLYVPIAPPATISTLFCRNMNYRVGYSHRLNNNDIIRALFEHGYRIGLN